MKRYIAGGGAAIAVILFFALTLPTDALGYVREGDATEIPDGCGVKLRDAIQSVYPSAPIADTQRWYCRRTLDDEKNPMGAHCYGEYDLTISGDEWHARTAADGLGAWPSLSEDEDADTVTVRRRTPGADLNAAQRAAHAPLFAGCILDDNEDPLTWGKIVDVNFTRDPESGTVIVKPFYIASEPKGSTIARLQREGKVNRTVVAEE
jgi:hypothetical protein